MAYLLDPLGHRSGLSRGLGLGLVLIGTCALAQVEGAYRYTGGDAFEPTIGTRDGVLYALSMKTSAASGVRRSLDRGVTWAEVFPNTELTLDPFLHVDTQTGRVFKLDLYNACSTLHFSDDQGETWHKNSLGCSELGGAVQDFPKLFTARYRGSPGPVPPPYPRLLYYCISRWPLDGACATSIDGGLTFGLYSTVFPGDECPDAIGSDDNGDMAEGVPAPDGTAYIIKGHCGRVQVARSVDNGKTWTRSTASSTTAPIPNHDAAVAVDDAGHVYAIWAHLGAVYVSASVDGGVSWSAPLDVAPAGMVRAVHPAAATGAQGRLAVAFVGADNLQTLPWRAYLTVVLNADELVKPPTERTRPVQSWTTMVSVPHRPIARGQCEDGSNKHCDTGDFIGLKIDDQGRPWASFVDVCDDTGNCRYYSSEYTYVQRRGFLGTLRSGPRLRGEGDLPPLPW